MNRYSSIFTADNKVIALCIGLLALIFFIDTMIPLGVAGGVTYILVVLVSLWSTNKALPYYVALAAIVLTIVGMLSSPLGGELWQVLINRLLAIAVILTTAFLSTQRRDALIEAKEALEKVKVLQGILPICSYCHNIRSDQGAWDAMESYIQSHSEARFSHGICPDCLPRARLEAGLDEE